MPSMSGSGSSSRSKSSSSRSTSTAASSPYINGVIFEQCILDEGLETVKITDHTHVPVSDVSGVFCGTLSKEAVFTVAVVEEIILPILSSDPKVHDIMFCCALIVCCNTCLLY